MNSMKTKSHIEIGLCQSCQHAKIIQNANRSRFYMCLLSNSNADFQRYPRLPVLTCSGYHPHNQTGTQK